MVESARVRPGQPEFTDPASLKSKLQNAFLSSVVTFIIGKDKVPISIHHGALPDSLKRMFEGSWREAKERSATLEDIDVHTFSLFGDYLYTRNYGLPTPTKRLPSTPPPRIVTVPDEAKSKSIILSDEIYNFLDGHYWGTHQPDRSFFNLFRRMETCEVSFEEECQEWVGEYMSETGIFVTNPFQNPFQDREELDLSMDYSETLVIQGRLYTFADQWCMPKLKKQIMQKIYFLLSELPPHITVIQSAIELIEVIYNGTAPSEPLRCILMSYIFSRAKRLHRCTDEFENLLISVPEFEQHLLAFFDGVRFVDPLGAAGY